MREMPVKREQASAGIDVSVRPGFAAAIDAVAEVADERHSFLRKAWFAGAGGERAHTLVAERPDGRVIAALPTIAAKFGVRAVPGSYWPYRSFPVAADAADEEIVAFLASKAARSALGRVWRLGPVYRDDPTASRLLRLAAAAGWTPLLRSLGTAYVLDLEALQADGGWPKTSTLRKYRWIERRLAELGDLEWRTIGGSGWDSATCDAIAEIERNSWVMKKTDGSDAKFAAPHNRRLWEAAMRDPKLAEAMSAALLYIGGKPAAFAFSVQAGRTRYYLANGYDDAFAKHSLGRALLYRDFQAAWDAGTRMIGWGSGDSGYKTEMGALPGPEILDILFVRPLALAALLRPLWQRSS